MKFVGSSIVTSGFHDGSGNATFDYTQGFAISPNGDKLFLISELGGPTAIGQDSLAQIKLSCFFGIGVAPTDIVSAIGTHLETAKRKIHINKCGKLIIPQKEELDVQLDNLYERASRNGALVNFVWANEIIINIAPSISAAMREKNLEKSKQLRKEFIKNDLEIWFCYLENL